VADAGDRLRPHRNGAAPAGAAGREASLNLPAEVKASRPGVVPVQAAAEVGGAPVSVSGSPRDLPGRRLLVEWWAILLLASLAIVLVNRHAPPDRASNLLYDSVQRIAPRPASEGILIIAIDNRSLAELGRWPWSRARHTLLMEQLIAGGVRAVGYDVLFLEPYVDPEVDEALGAAFARQGRTILPHLIEIPGADGRPSDTILPVPAIAGGARTLAHVVTRPDRDGVVRGVDRLEDDRGRRYLHMSEALAAIAAGDDATVDAPDPVPSSPVLAPARDLIRFTRGPGGYSQVSFVDVMEGRLPPELLRDRIVLVGATGSGLGDRFSTPMSGTEETMSGVEIHANYLDSLQTGQIIRPAPELALQLFSLVPLWLLMMSLINFGPRVNLWLGVALGLTLILVSLVALTVFRLWLPPATPLIALGLIFPLWGWRRLDVANRYMIGELRELRAEAPILPRNRPEVRGDPVARQIILMHEAIRDVRDLRQFIAQSLDNLPDAALVTDLDGRILIANAAADRLFEPRLGGPAEGRALAAVFATLDVDPAFPDPRAAQLLEALRLGNLPPDHGYETRLANGQSLEIRLAYFTDAGRRPLGWIARFADITDLRASERQREDALRLLTHDMRSPQAAILAVLNAEGRRIPPDVAQRLGRYAHQTLSLADDFVQYARAESGRFTVETFDLADAMVDAVDDVWPLARAKGMRIETGTGEEPLLVSGDRALITRAVTNLLSNAIKFSGSGTRITARVAPEGSFASLSVADEGRGIAPEDLDQLFEPFQRLAPPEGATAASDAPGSGLGLAFVKTVVERHQGGVFVTSTEGQGSTFGFRLPLLC
jgi:CHASE2 domain-containing sensor protein/signal transduction histidine kinase